MNDQISKPVSFDYALMGLTAIVWASAFIAIKVVVPETGPLWLAAWRVLIGFIVLTPYAIWRGLVWPTSNRMWVMLFIATLFNTVFPFILISWAEKTIDAGVVSLLMGTGPFMALIGSHFSTTDDRLTWPKMLAVLMGFAGVLIIIGVDVFNDLGGATSLSQFAAIGGAVCYVIAGLMVRKVDLPPVRMSWLVLGLGAVTLLMMALVFDGSPNIALGTTVLWSLIYLGVMPTGLGQLLRMYLVKKVGYSVFSLSLNLIPVFGVGLGALLLGEVITARTTLALALVLGGLFVSRWEPKKRQ